MIIKETPRYRFELRYDEETFTIVAISVPDCHCSSINTLNAILSAFDIDEDSPLMMEESDWEGTPEEVQAWVRQAADLFRDDDFVRDLEKALDADRKEGEWENVAAL